MRWSILLFVFSIFDSFADIKSSSGEIRFDINHDSKIEAYLNSTGLGVGIEPSANLHIPGQALVTGDLKIGVANSNSNLFLSGTWSQVPLTISTNSTLDSAYVYLADSSSDNLLLYLPYAGNVSGRMIQIKKISSQNYVWVTSGSNLLDLTTVIQLPPSNSNFAQVKLFSNGEDWWIMNASGLSDTLSSDNLVLWYKLDESSGTIASDSSQNSHDGTLTSLDFSTDSVDAFVYKGLEFGGSADYVSLSDHADLSILNGSVSMWVYIRDFTNSYFVTKDPSGRNDDLAIGISGSSFWDGIPSNKIAMRIQKGSDHVVYDNTTSAADTWHHVVGTWGDAGMKLYVNGELKDTNVYTGGIDNSAVFNLATLRNGTGTTVLDGYLDDVRVYNKALSIQEVKALFGQ